MYREQAQSILRPALNLSYAKSLRPDIDPALLAVKSVGRDEVRGYVALWGNPGRVDLEQEYFTPDTDFWDGILKGAPRPLTYDHAQDSATRNNPVVGHISEMGDDEVGRWYVAQLERAHRYRRAIDALIERGALGTSSDSAPQYVLREQRGKSTWLRRWPLFAAALTTDPCEPRMTGTVDYIKSLGLQLPEPEAALVEPRYSVEVARMRLDLLQLEV